MRLVVGITACALTAATGVGARQTPTPAPTANDALVRTFATPRYYRISASGGRKSQNGDRMCFGGEALRKMFDGIREVAKDPKAFAQINKGCTKNAVRNGASVSIEQDCKKGAGALFTSHTRLSGTLDDFHQHYEVTLKGIGPDGADKILISDLAMAYLGQCPANVKPGQILKPDGTVFDPYVNLARPAGKTREPAGADSPK